MAFFTPQRVYAVLGASTNPSKFGNIITNWYINHSLPAIPVNPTSSEILTLKTSPTLTDAIKTAYAEHPDIDGISVSVVTPPQISKKAMEDLGKEVKSVWFQPGSYDQESIDIAKSKGVEVIAGGKCILVLGESMMTAAKL
ncbi:CYFA0S16e00276g1_1 [Cyberlindnera fabianii]|uniref:Acetate--CoA ligase [ADP-forming] I n=1 Tax=Cyberlindnera fabianii TaxID=36022 RepID=A0A061B531_CYBFA|nr:Acetate--CoA ligase [ADP-forming] I [Cyberlindnera fabianii]CDR44939.1 CYFA0S16e00276g1_1 [Cyberlindnera fabianii]